MGRVSAPIGATAISFNPGNGIDLVPEAGANPGNGTIDDDWFAQVAFDVFGAKEAGQQLHLATGWPRTSCYAFVARDLDKRRKVSAEFLRVLFATPHGEPFFNAFMHGCPAPWWLDLQRRLRNADKVAALDLE